MYLSTDQKNADHPHSIVGVKERRRFRWSYRRIGIGQAFSFLETREHPLIYFAFKKPLSAHAFSVSKEMQPFSAAFVSISPAFSNQRNLYFMAFIVSGVLSGYFFTQVSTRYLCRTFPVEYAMIPVFSALFHWRSAFHHRNHSFSYLGFQRY
jgi:hypothetical protein